MKIGSIGSLWRFVTKGFTEKASPPEVQYKRFSFRRLRAAIQDTKLQYRQGPDAREEVEAMRPHFDAEFYLATNPDVLAAAVDPFIHFCAHGWREGRDPNAEFSTLGYLNSKPGVVVENVNPFLHYLRSAKKVRPGHSSPPAKTEKASPISSRNDRLKSEMKDLSKWFDAEYYLRRYPDVAKAGVDPLWHFVSNGWSEGRDPSSDFSVRYYLESNPDVASAGVNPYWHYVVAGRREGRLAGHPGGFRSEILLRTEPLEVSAHARQPGMPSEPLAAGSTLVARLFDLCGGTKPALMVSLGHDNYRKVVGGVQLCLQVEEEEATARGMLYLNLHPYRSLPRLSHPAEDPDPLVRVLLGGKDAGVMPTSAVIKALRAVQPSLSSIEVVVHHLMGHQPEQLAEIIAVSGGRSCRFWVHDFFSLCPSYTLQRNNVAFCGAPALASNACTLCLYGEERRAHLLRFATFFAAHEVHVIAPSRFAADYWAEHSTLKAASVSVSELVEIGWTEVGTEATQPDDAPITIGFIGFPAPHKGWPMFEAIVRACSSDALRFRFAYFGTGAVALDKIERFPVSVSAEDPDAMIRAVSAQNVDFVLHWASWSETFSFSTYEALAAGAWVLTNPISGNVAATILRTGLGLVLESEADLLAFFRDGRIQAATKALRARRRLQRPVLTRSRMTHDILDREVAE